MRISLPLLFWPPAVLLLATQADVLYGSLHQAGAVVQYTAYWRAHNRWAIVFKESLLLSWLFRQCRQAESRD